MKNQARKRLLVCVLTIIMMLCSFPAVFAYGSGEIGDAELYTRFSPGMDAGSEPPLNTSFIPHPVPDIEPDQYGLLMQPHTTESWSGTSSNNAATTFASDSSNILSITSTQPVAARFRRTFTIPANRNFRFTAEVRSNAVLTENIGAAILFQVGAGTIGWDNWGYASYDHTRNNTWQTIELEFSSGSNTTVAIELNHGFFWENFAQGTTQFRNLRLEELTVASTDTNWRVLNVLIRHADSRGNMNVPAANRVLISADANDVLNVQNFGQRFEQSMARLSNNQMSATVTTVILDDVIDRWYNIWYSFWPGFSQIHHILLRNGINPRDYDYIMATVRMNCRDTGANIPSPNWWGLAYGYGGVRYGIQNIIPYQEPTWWNAPNRYGVYIHEFLHALEYYGRTGNIVDHANNFELNDGRHPPHHFRDSDGYNMFYIQFLRRQLRVRTTTNPEQPNGAIAGQINFGLPAGTFTRQRLSAAEVIYHLPYSPTHIVTFDLQGGTGNFPPQTVNHGAFATQPAATPTRANYDFVGWFAHPTTGDTPFAFAITAITANTTIYARWTPTMRTVTFDPYPGTPPSIDPINVPHGSTIGTMPAAPTRDDGYEFAGWWANGTEITADTPITQNWNVTARWAPPGTYVFFNLQGGGPANSPDFAPQFMSNGAFATRPATHPTLTGHTFAGWWTAPIGGALFNFEATPITENTTLYARWTAVSHTAIARFHFDGGSVEVPITIGQAILASDIPIPATRYGSHGRPGQAFMGWFAVAPFNNMHYVNSPNRAVAFDFTQPITAEMLTDGVLNLYGSWLRYGNVLGRGNENTMPNMMDHGMLHARALGMITDADLIMVTADVNVDGSVNMADHGMLHRFVLGMPTILGIPAP